MKLAFVTGGSGFVGQRLIPLLVRSGCAVRAMARNSKSEEILSRLGATPVPVDLSNEKSLEGPLEGCTHVIHAAARFINWGTYSDFYETNVVGTDRILRASARSGSVGCFIYVGASAVVMGKKKVHNADESWPLQYPSYSPYIKTKALAEDLVLRADAPGFRTLSIRPGWIWGPGDHSIKTLVESVKKNQLVWINQGRYEYVTSHVDNVCYAILLAAENHSARGPYFITDGDTVVFREWVTKLLETRGLTPKNVSLPYGLAWACASAVETVWKKCGLRKDPPVTRTTLRMIGQEFTVSSEKAKKELGYVPIVSRDEGLRSLEEIGT
jgi:nucleoside-diphosphate-sugar epimerase